MHCSNSSSLSDIYKPAEIVDKETLLDAFSTDITDNDYIAKGVKHDVLSSFSRLLRATDYRMKQCKTINEGALSRWDFRINSIVYHSNTGYYRLRYDLRSVKRKIQRFTHKSHEVMDKFCNMESNVIHKEFMQWTVEWPSPMTQNVISNQWPVLMQSPTYEMGCALWHCQLRKIAFHKPNTEHGVYYKLGIFVAPKHVSNLSDVIALHAKLKITLCVSYTELSDKHDTYSPKQVTMKRDAFGNIVERIQIESKADGKQMHGTEEAIESTELPHSLDVQTRDILFDIDTNFVKMQDNDAKLMSWGKFVPDLQDVIDEKTGNIPHQKVCVDVTVRIIDQCVTYKCKEDLQRKKL